MTPLVTEQIQYASTDSWAALTIFDFVKLSVEIGTKISSKNCLSSTVISLKPHSSKVPIAYEQTTGTYNGASISVLINVTRVRVPGFRPPKLGVEENVTLGSYGSPPFQLEVLANSLVAAEKMHSLKQDEASSIQNQDISQPIKSDNRRASPSQAIHQAKVDPIFAEMFWK